MLSDTEVNTENKNEETKNFSWEVVDFFKDLVIILLIVFIIRTFLVMPFQINGSSMMESYYDREFIIVDRLSYIISTPERWDVVVFKPHVSKDKEFFLKRIVGIPGDHLKIEDGEVYLKKNGEWDYVQLNEEYLADYNKWFTFIWRNKNWEKVEYIVPTGKYFVMWDNRNNSTDSRECFSRCSSEWASNFAFKSDLTWRVLIDLGYFNFKTFSFIHPTDGRDTSPRFLNSPRNYEY